MLIYLLKSRAEILNSCRRVGGWLTLSVPHHLYVKHFKVDAITLLWWLRVSILQQTAEKGSFLQNKLKWWWCVPFVLLPSWWFITIQIESIYISLALVKWAFQLDWIRIWEVQKRKAIFNGFPFLSMIYHGNYDIKLGFAFCLWIKKEPVQSIISHDDYSLFWSLHQPPTHQSIPSHRNVKFVRMGNNIIKWSWFRI